MTAVTIALHLVTGTGPNTIPTPAPPVLVIFGAYSASGLLYWPCSGVSCCRPADVSLRAVPAGAGVMTYRPGIEADPPAHFCLGGLPASPLRSVLLIGAETFRK